MFVAMTVCKSLALCDNNDLCLLGFCPHQKLGYVRMFCDCLSDPDMHHDDRIHDLFNRSRKGMRVIRCRSP